MKKSEELKQRAEQEDNDIKAFGIYTKVIREEREERWKEEWLEKLSNNLDVTHSISKGCYTFAKEPHGVMDYYPKANKLLIRKQNKWKKPGLKFIISNVL